MEKKLIELSVKLLESAHSNREVGFLSNLTNREVMMQVAKELQQLAREANLEHWIAMQESSFEG